MKNLIDPFRTLGRAALDLVFPVSCLGCGMEGSYLCAACLAKLPRESRQVCIRCQQPSPFGKTHPDCRSRNFADGLISCLPYPNPLVKKTIETFKYHFVDALAENLSKFMAEEFENQNLSAFFGGFLLVPVPLHKRRQVWRGFNQAELLSESLSRILNIGVEKNLLTRVRHTKPQVTLNARERTENMREAFSVNGIAPGKYLIIDDVVTSGSTINEISKALKRAGASEVWAATVARD
ncbi:MAG: ComF family protein [Candidatus Saccharibacteria bacterium]